MDLLLDNKLNFQQHVSKIIQNSFYKLKIIYSYRHILSTKIKLLLCDSLILSNFNYCDVVYDQCTDGTDVKSIQRVQNACLCFNYGIRKRERISHTSSQANWLNMHNRRALHSAASYHKIIKLKSPPYLYNKIKFRTDVHNINIRQKNLTIAKHTTEFKKILFTYCIAYIYNATPNDIKAITRITAYRKK